MISVRSELDSPTVSVLITNTSRVHRVCVNAVIQAEKRPQNNLNKMVLFWGRNKQCRQQHLRRLEVRAVFVISTLTLGLFSFERTKTLRYNASLLNPHSSREFLLKIYMNRYNRSGMHLCAFIVYRGYILHHQILCFLYGNCNGGRVKAVPSCVL